MNDILLGHKVQRVDKELLPVLNNEVFIRRIREKKKYDILFLNEKPEPKKPVSKNNSKINLASLLKIPAKNEADMKTSQPTSARA